MWLILTLVLVAALVAGLAVYLLAVALALIDARRSVSGIADVLETIAVDVEPLAERLVTINGAMSVLETGLASADGHLGRAARVFRL